MCAQAVRTQSGTTIDVTQLLQAERDDKRWLQELAKQQQELAKQQQTQYAEADKERQKLSKKCEEIPDLTQKLEKANVKMLKLKCALNARGAVRGCCFGPAVS